jgi:NADH dehydrogenase
MQLNNKIITIFGGSGFLGRHIVKSLAQSGATINILTRDPEKALFLKMAGSVGQINLIRGNISNTKLVEELVKNSHIIINAVGILFEKRKFDFVNTHAKFPETLAHAAQRYNIERFIHISALGCDVDTQSNYAKTKLAGETAILNTFPTATILRPSVIFGKEDNFFNQFAKMAKYSPFLPLIGGGKNYFQPVYVGDIAKAINKILQNPRTKGKIYELGGPDVVSFKQVLQYTSQTINRHPILLNIPFPIAKLIAYFMELLPTPPLTRDQVKSLQTDNVTHGKHKTFFDLGIHTKTIEETVPQYLN